MRTIKRYPNRKLYDLERKRYVTLNDITIMIQDGEDIQVVDHETGEDLTSITLSQIIFEREKKRSGRLPKPILTALIRTSTAPLDYLKKSFGASFSALHLLEGEIEQLVDGLVAKGDIAQDDAERVRAELSSEMETSSRRRLSDLGLDAALNRLNIPTHEDIKALEAQIEKLVASVDVLLAASEERERSSSSTETASAADDVTQKK